MLPVRSAICLLMLLTSFSHCKSRKQEAKLTDAGIQGEEACLFGDQTQPSYGSSGASSIDLLSWKIISSLAAASDAAYLEPDGVRQQANAWGYPTIEHFGYGSMYAYLMTNDHCAVLAFRGTDMKSLSDWLVNLDAPRKGVEGGKVHEGFYDAETGLHRQILRALNRGSVSRKTFWVTGHSLGGALAGIFALKSKFERWIGDGPEMHRIVTFGQPLFADGALAKKLRNTFVNKYYRVVNETDLVARVPFWMTHFGSLVWLRKGQVDFRPDRFLAGGSNGSSNPDVMGASIPSELTADEAAYRDFLEQTKNLPKGAIMPGRMKVTGGYGAQWPKFIDDHMMANYMRRIRNEIDDYK